MNPEPVKTPGVIAKAAHTYMQAAAPQAKPAAGLSLPLQVLTKADVSRLGREINEIESFFEVAAIKGATTKTVPQTSQQMTLIMNENGLNVLRQEDRLQINTFLKMLREKAPIVHTSFAADPKPDFLMKLVEWFRKEAHPYVLLQVGLQPSIAAGCVIRTTNKYFDFSFKKHFEESKARLGASLRAQA